MAVVLALVTAAVFGAADFVGGVAAMRARVLQVVAGSHVVGAAGSVVAALVLAETVTGRDLALGVVGGAFGVVGVGLLYRRLAVGPMSVVAPLTAITSAVVPAAWGVAGGERLSALGWAGVGLAVIAVGLVSSAPDGGGGRTGAPAPVTAQVVGESLLAGVGFGGMFIALDATESATAPWPVAGARLFTSTVLVGVVVVTARRRGLPVLPATTTAPWLIVGVGVLDTTANITFLYATTLGDLAVVSVLSALYPVSTVILARLVLGERMTRTQGAGFVAALLATELLVVG